MIIKLYEMPVMSKEEALLKINEYFVENEITDQSYYEGILLREKQAPFYIGNYIAIPHALFEYTKHIKQNGLIILRFINPID
ncbi:MAG: PTS sugar transporter subunit IIA [Bacilli bacterium]